MDHEQDNPDDEQYPGNLRSNRRYAGGSEDTGNQTNDQKNESVIQHSDTSLSQPNKAEGVPYGFVAQDQRLADIPSRTDVAECCKSSAGRPRTVARLSNS
jgi:hypothetical protein